jgi:hypothetical protein
MSRMSILYESYVDFVWIICRFCMSHMSNYDLVKYIFNFKVNCRTVLSDIEHSVTVHMSQTVNVWRQTLYINTNTFLISQLHAGNDHPLAGRYGNAHRILHDFRLQSRCKLGLRSSVWLHSVSSCDPLNRREENQKCNQWHILVGSQAGKFPASNRSLVRKDWGKSQTTSAKWPVIRLKLGTDTCRIQYKSLSAREKRIASKYLYMNDHRTMSVVQLVVASGRAWH